MSDRDWLAARFEEERPHLRRIAYRMLGSLDESDDAIQEAWLRLNRTDQSQHESLTPPWKCIALDGGRAGFLRDVKETLRPHLCDAAAEALGERKMVPTCHPKPQFPGN